MKKLTALIPARGGSKGVPKKNIKELIDHPLLAYSIAVCKMAGSIERVIVSTDNQEIADVALKYGAEVPFIRPPELAKDDSKDIDVIKHYFEQVGGEEVAYVRPTTPLRVPSVIDYCIENYFNNQREYCTGVRSMHELPESPHKMFMINDDGECCGFFPDFNGIKNYTNLPRQMFPKAYQPNGYLDIVKKSTLSGGDTFGDVILPIVTEEVIEVDTQYQFNQLEDLLKVRGHVLLGGLNYDQNKT
jgi:CMP-N-acetylneuraminic acid synthetase|tara:strand:- start:6596 stop:7330 length:735 start_codon:yes stop_codon:yes gene_type:complete